MAQTIESLWPDQIRPKALSPNAILKAQAIALAKQTGSVLLGEIRLNEEEKGILKLEFNILVLALGDYRHRILTIAHRANLPYPAVVDAEVLRPESQLVLKRFLEATGVIPPDNRADSDTQLISLVSRVLRSPQVLSAAQSLIARASDALGDESQPFELSNPSTLEPATDREAEIESTDEEPD